MTTIHLLSVWKTFMSAKCPLCLFTVKMTKLLRVKTHRKSAPSSLPSIKKLSSPKIITPRGPHKLSVKLSRKSKSNSKNTKSAKRTESSSAASFPTSLIKAKATKKVSKGPYENKTQLHLSMTSQSHHQSTKSLKLTISKLIANAKLPIPTPPTISLIGKVIMKRQSIFLASQLAIRHCPIDSAKKIISHHLFNPQEPTRINIDHNRSKICTRWKSHKTESTKLENNSKDTSVQFRTTHFKIPWLISVVKRSYTKNPLIETAIETVTENLIQRPKNSTSVFPNSKTSNKEPLPHNRLQNSLSIIKTLIKQATTCKKIHKARNSPQSAWKRSFAQSANARMNQ